MIGGVYLLLAPFALTGTTPASVSSVLTDVGTVVTQAMSWAASVAEMIVSTPIVMVFVSVALVGLGVGLIRRMISL